MRILITVLCVIDCLTLTRAAACESRPGDGTFSLKDFTFTALESSSWKWAGHFAGITGFPTGVSQSATSTSSIAGESTSSSSVVTPDPIVTTPADAVTSSAPTSISTPAVIADPGAITTTTPLATPTASSLVPLTYQNPTFLQSKSSIIAHSLASFQALLTILTPSNSGGWVGAVAWESIPQWDLLHGTRTFYNDFQATITALSSSDQGCSWGVDLVNCYNDDSGWAGLMALQGYESYGDQGYLVLAVGVWEFITAHGLVTQGVIDAGYLVGTKASTATVGATCNGQSNIGGVYWENGGPTDSGRAANDYLASVSTGNYALLSVELCRLTQNNTFCDYGLSSLQFLDRHLVDSGGLVGDGMGSSSCTVNGGTLTYNTGLYVAAYAVLGQVTSTASYLSLAAKSAQAAISTVNWNSAQGVIAEGEGDPALGDDNLTWKSVLIRSLAKAAIYLDANTRSAIVQYINIQYWSLTQLDSDSGVNPVWYGRNWTGPGYTTYTLQSQIDVLAVLNGLGLNPDSAFPTPGDDTKPVMSLPDVRIVAGL